MWVIKVYLKGNPRLSAGCAVTSAEVKDEAMKLFNDCFEKSQSFPLVAEAADIPESILGVEVVKHAASSVSAGDAAFLISACIKRAYGLA